MSKKNIPKIIKAGKIPLVTRIYPTFSIMELRLAVIMLYRCLHTNWCQTFSRLCLHSVVIYRFNIFLPQSYLFVDFLNFSSMYLPQSQLYIIITRAVLTKQPISPTESKCKCCDCLPKMAILCCHCMTYYVTKYIQYVHVL